jgi:hypothetical protein
MAKQDFKTAALGIPDLSQGNWLIQDVGGHGLLKGIGAAAPQVENTLNAAPAAPLARP